MKEKLYTQAEAILKIQKKEWKTAISTQGYRLKASDIGEIYYGHITSLDTEWVREIHFYTNPEDLWVEGDIIPCKKEMNKFNYEKLIDEVMKPGNHKRIIEFYPINDEKYLKIIYMAGVDQFYLIPENDYDQKLSLGYHVALFKGMFKWHQE